MALTPNTLLESLNLQILPAMCSLPLEGPSRGLRYRFSANRASSPQYGHIGRFHTFFQVLTRSGSRADIPMFGVLGDDIDPRNIFSSRY